MSKAIHRYLNAIPESNIHETVVYWDGLKSKFALKFRDGSFKVYSIRHFNDLLNFSIFTERAENKISNTEQILKDSCGKIYEEESGFTRFDLSRFKETSSEKTNELDVSPNSSDISEGIEDPDGISSTKLSAFGWHFFPIYFKLIVKTAAELLTTHPEQARIFSLGQSPAWIIKAAEMLDKGTHKFGYIPFSGNSYELVSEDYNAEHAVYKLNPYTEKARISESKMKYQRTLESLELSPTKILEHYKHYHEKTIIVEFTYSGKGLASFLSILFGLARDEGLFDEVKEAVKIIILDDIPADFASKQTMTVEGMTISCNHQLVDNIKGVELMWTISNGEDKGEFSERLVPSYPYKMWDEPSVAITGNEAHIAELEAKLAGAVAEYSAGLDG